MVASLLIPQGFLFVIADWRLLGRLVRANTNLAVLRVERVVEARFAELKGLVGDLLIGIIGAFIGGWLMPRLGLHLGTGVVAAILNATIGAIVLLFVIRLVRGGGRWNSGWGGGWLRRWR